MAQVTNYQCPSCTGPLHFSSKTNRLECDYCGSSYEVSEIDAKFNAKIDEAKNESDKKQKDNVGCRNAADVILVLNIVGQ